MIIISYLLDDYFLINDSDFSNAKTFFDVQNIILSLSGVYEKWI